MRIAISILILGVGFALAGCSLQYDAMGYGPGSPLIDIGGSGPGAGGAAGNAGGTDSTGAPY